MDENDMEEVEERPEDDSGCIFFILMVSIAALSIVCWGIMDRISALEAQVKELQTVKEKK